MGELGGGTNPVRKQSRGGGGNMKKGHWQCSGVGRGDRCHPVGPPPRGQYGSRSTWLVYGGEADPGMSYRHAARASRTRSCASLGGASCGCGPEPTAAAPPPPPPAPLAPSCTQRAGDRCVGAT